MTMLRLVMFLVGALLWSTSIQAAYPLKILGLFPHPGVSHFHFFHPIMRGLADAGHEVTVVSHFPDKDPPARYKDLALGGKSVLTNSVDLKIFESRHFYNHFLEFFLLYEWGRDACNHTLKSEAMVQVLQRKTQYDLILMEQFNSDCMLGVAHFLKVPVIALSSCAMMPWHYERMGSPIIPSYIPVVWLKHSQDMDFFQRLANWFTFHSMILLYNYFTVRSDNAMIRYKFGQDVPSTKDLAKGTSLYLVNQHFSLSGVKPLPPAVIEIGGIHIQKAKPLSVELQRFLDNAEHGVVFISWGSMIRAESLPTAKRDGIIKAVRRLKQKVIWKWENETLVNKPDNVYIDKWLPQRDILCHPNVKVFMTHAGLMGSSEAAYCGVPVVATPMYGDQFVNAAALSQRGMGVILNYEDINENTVLRAVKKVLEKEYLANAHMVSQSYKQRPQTALQTAIWWVEYVARTKGATLSKSSAVDLPRFAYYSLDVYLFIALIVVGSISSWLWIFKTFCRASKSIKKIKRN